ncbi:VOC family protein [Acinetobacter baumannii]|uniref:2-oxoadipate dioxygenase/decarboxylase HglS n=1 Tax=Acinetobacter baumannii TaxID=470 RepID=UPI0026FE02F4|nr:VOC family protein [Acinetobacter baumannii]
MANWMGADEIRAQFSKMMSDMYQQEVPLYGDLVELVNDVNHVTLHRDTELKEQLEKTGELPRLSQERHGAIRLGTADELRNMRRVFAVMGMYPVGYYDLVPAGVPVHSTAFRAIDADSLNYSPFRVFTSLLRLELIENAELRELAEKVLFNRQIFTDKALALTEKHEQQGGLDPVDAMQFVNEVLETFRWHTDAPISKDLYQALHDQHRLIADVVAFKGPHINHLTPRTLDIDLVQHSMASRGITPKAVVEGPPRRRCPILLRQTSFKALQEQVIFTDQQGSHTARFGEIEQRGVALTPKGRHLYDQLLEKARQRLGGVPDETNAIQYEQILHEVFHDFPDTYLELAAQDLAYFYYIPQVKIKVLQERSWKEQDLIELIQIGKVLIEPIVYEDFLPVSAAGIFQSNLGGNGQTDYSSVSNQGIFEQCLGAKVFDEMQLYAETQQHSIEVCLAALNQTFVSGV